MKRLVILLILPLLISSCRKPTLDEILRAAMYSIDEACSVEYLDNEECITANNIYNAVKSFVEKNDEEAKKNLKIAIVNELNKLPEGSKIKFYFSWILLI